MSDATIEVTGLRKRFGPTVALDGMSFTVQPGQVTGFVGPNGAGKSTTMRVILGLDAADAGTALVGGRPYRSLRRPLSHVGSLLDAGRAAAQPDRPQPPAVAGPFSGPGPPAGSTRSSSRPGCGRRPGARPAATRWACGSGSGSRRRCSATRRC